MGGPISDWCPYKRRLGHRQQREDAVNTHREETAIYKTNRAAWVGTNPAGTWVLDFQPLAP